MGADRGRGVLAVAALAGLTLGAGLGGGRLSYHEAIWAQSAREMIAGGDLLTPHLDGRPWLEKPPLGTWLIAAVGRVVGRVDESVARLPTAVGAAALAGVVGRLAARRFGGRVGLLAAAVQLTTAWLVMRGRLAEVDVVLAAIVAGAIAAFDRLREAARSGGDPAPARRAFFLLIGLTALAKGVGFGAALALATAAATLIWDRDRSTLRALLRSPADAAAGALIALAWPLLEAARHPGAVGLWVAHVSDRLASSPEQFAGEPAWGYAASILGQTLPWTPLAIGGAIRSFARARRGPGGGDRLLWAWAVVPAALVSMASVRNAHYLIYALPPWAIWGALGLSRLADRLTGRGWSPGSLRRAAVAGFGALGLAWGAGLGLVAPRFDGRAPEWAFYEAAGRRVGRAEPLVLLYDWPEWDRFPYATPFGPFPHDLAVRLFYLDRPATWRAGAGSMAGGPGSGAGGGGPFAVIGREGAVEALRATPGRRVDILARGPRSRWDRAYVLARVTPGRAMAPAMASSSRGGGRGR